MQRAEIAETIKTQSTQRARRILLDNLCALPPRSPRSRRGGRARGDVSNAELAEPAEFSRFPGMISAPSACSAFKSSLRARRWNRLCALLPIALRDRAEGTERAETFQTPSSQSPQSLPRFLGAISAPSACSAFKSSLRARRWHRLCGLLPTRRVTTSDGGSASALCSRGAFRWHLEDPYGGAVLGRIPQLRDEQRISS
jgi:hypothetical protein